MSLSHLDLDKEFKPSSQIPVCKRKSLGPLEYLNWKINDSTILLLLFYILYIYINIYLYIILGQLHTCTTSDSD
jgi:hypothetical protein